MTWLPAQISKAQTAYACEGMAGCVCGSHCHSPAPPPCSLRDPCSAKGLLRAAQARIGIGASEYSTAAGLLARALAAVREQGLPTAGVCSTRTMHWLEMRTQCQRAHVMVLILTPLHMYTHTHTLPLCHHRCAVRDAQAA
jgi:hypothetical protein